MGCDMRNARLNVMLLATLLLASPSAAKRTPETRRARPLSTNVAPNYPDVLWIAAIGGVVRVTFAVDSTGRPLMASLVVRAAENDLFVIPVKRAVERWRFVPAQRGGHAVVDTIEQVIEYVPPRPELNLVASSTVLARDSLGAGRWRMVIGVEPLVETGSLVPQEMRLPIAEAALDTLLASLPVEGRYPPRIACVALKPADTLEDPPLSLLRALSGPSYTVVAARRCPPSFSSPIRVVRADGTLGPPDPPGEDPWAFTPLAPRAVDDSTALIDIAMSHATSFATYHCYARRDPTRPRGWRAVCQRGRMGLW